MPILTFLLVAILLMIFVGALLGKIGWDRAIVLLIIVAVVAAVLWYFVPGL